MNGNIHPKLFIIKKYQQQFKYTGNELNDDIGM